MYIDAKQIIKWKNTSVPHPKLACALCGRRIAPDEKCLSAIWRAQGGQYIQAFHPVCGKIVKLWGYPNSFLSPKAAEAWGSETGCDGCGMRPKCLMYVFDCQRALSRLLILGGASGSHTIKTEEPEENTDRRLGGWHLGLDDRSDGR